MIRSAAALGLAAAAFVATSGLAAAEPVAHEVVVPAPGAELAGTLLVPDNPKGVLVFVTGAGPHPRDQVISGAPMFAELAEALAEGGWASLRVDERGVEGSTGEITPHALARVQDVVATIDFAASQGLGPVGVLGHSEGALIAPLAEAERGRAVEFLVLLGAPAAPGSEVWIDQQMANTRAHFGEAATPEKLQAAEDALTALVAASIEGDDAGVEEATDALFRAWGAPQDIWEDGTVAGFAERMASPEMEVYLGLDPAAGYAASTDPRLAVYGDLDTQTAPDLNAPLLMDASAPGQTTLVVLEDQDHFFLRGEGLAPGEHAFGEMALAPELPAAILDWLETRR
ncbi:MAG: alpha/beta fold hydrolase [Oceanicaulis sp.]